MTNEIKEQWIERITKELKHNNAPVWYSGDLIYELRGYFKVIKKDLHNMCLITLK